MKRILKTLAYSALLLALPLALSGCGGKSDLDPDSGKTDPTPSGPDKPAEQVKYNPSKDKIVLLHEFRGAWLATVGGLDWPKSKDAQIQQNTLRNMIHAIKNANCNAVVMQVCCNSDAMWNSSILPWSSVLTGTMGKDPGYDPLLLAVQTAHNDGMEIHAWINPMRVGSVDAVRPESHPSKSHPEWTQRYGSSLYWDPANPEVISYLESLASELMSKYDLDGLHIDDFFYPDGLKDDAKEWDDSEEYAATGDGLSLEKWRERNINRLVKALYDGVHKTKPDKIFGVSPAGRLVLTRYLYADPVQWVQEGTVDYLAPQIYWQHSHSIAPFLPTMKSWKEVAAAGGADKQVPVLIGLAPYRVNESGWGLPEFKTQVEDCRNNSDWVSGNIWFRTEHLTTTSFSGYVTSNIYPRESLIPKLGKGYKNTAGAPAAPSVKANGKAIEWNAVPGAEGYAVYELVQQSKSSTGAVTWKAELVTKGEMLRYPGTAGKNYAVISYKGKDKSALSQVVFIE